jgi:hypothetical protein
MSPASPWDLVVGKECPPEIYPILLLMDTLLYLDNYRYGVVGVTTLEKSSRNGKFLSS